MLVKALSLVPKHAVLAANRVYAGIPVHILAVAAPGDAPAR